MRAFGEERVWIFGAGSFGRALAAAARRQNVAVLGFVQTEPRTAEVDGLPVRSWAGLREADRSLPLWLGIFNRDTPYDGLVQLAREAGCSRIVLPWDLYGRFAAELGWRYWLADPSDLVEHADDLARTEARLADDASRLCLRRVVAFRSGRDLDYAAFTHDECQYFNALTLPARDGRPLRYLDGGAYVGDSWLALRRQREVDTAWLFEPDPANFERLVRNVQAETSPALCLPLALADGYRVLRFDAGQGEAGRLTADGDTGIATVSIDALLAGQGVDLIKLDVEGGEDAALRGAAATLSRHRPVLAISIYHRPQDLWALPDLLGELAPGYRLHLRQHAFNSFELVLYAVPAERGG